MYKTFHNVAVSLHRGGFRIHCSACCTSVTMRVMKHVAAESCALWCETRTVWTRFCTTVAFPSSTSVRRQCEPSPHIPSQRRQIGSTPLLLHKQRNKSDPVFLPHALKLRPLVPSLRTQNPKPDQSRSCSLCPVLRQPTRKHSSSLRWQRPTSLHSAPLQPPPAVPHPRDAEFLTFHSLWHSYFLSPSHTPAPETS